MKPNITKILWKVSLAALLTLALPFLIYAQSIKISIEPETQRVSASINNAPLKQIIERIKVKKQLWVKGEHHLEGRDLSVEFEDLSLEKALKRILARVNHSFVYDRNGGISGVIIVKTEDSKWIRSSTPSRRRRIPPRRSPRRR